MKERSENITIYFQTPAFSDTYTQDDFKAQVREIADYALIHTGVPTEGDYLRWQYGGWKYENATAQSAEVDGETVYQWTIPFTFTYYTTLDQEQEVDGTVEELLQSWDLSDAPDYLKLRTIYDYICEHVTYDHDHVNDSSYKLQYTAYAALENGTAVCQGYAVLLYRLSLELEVDCRLIAGTGNTDPHGWNIAQLSDLYYNLDSTWDAGSSEYKYFLKCEENFGSHTRDDEYNTERFHTDYPMSDTDYTPTAGDTCRSHHYESEVTTEATCTTDGTITYTCPNCGDSYQETIPMTGHSWGDWVQTAAPTCTEAGVERRSCANCDAVETREVEALGHSWDNGVVTKEPTEEETGLRTYTCETCGETKTEEIPVLEHTHSYTKTVTAPTCTEKGYTTYTCTCGDSYIDDEVDALGHSWDDGVVTKEPTEEETGIRTYTCETCGETKTEEIPV
ncbi:MAG: transglutaminase domain-containing protein, partial [Candidatus Onthomonas sp.]